MSWLDWTIVVIPLIVVYALGIYSSRYANSVADFLSAGRLCGRREIFHLLFQLAADSARVTSCAESVFLP